MKSRALALLFAVALTLFAACEGQYVTAASGVEIKRSGILAQGSPVVETVYWTDDTHVLVIGVRPGVFEALPGGKKTLKNFLMQWDTTTGDVKTLTEVGEYSGLCYDRGYVRYGFRTGQRLTVKAGPLGNEVDISSSLSSADMNDIRVNPFSCREYNERELRTKFGTGIWPLREEHGYWGGREDALQKKMSVYIKTVNGVTQELLVPILGPVPRWSEYAGAYVFKRSEDLFSKTKTTGKMWLLMPDGQTKEFDIPAGPWFGGSTGYGTTRRGIFMYSHALENLGNGDAGGYLLQNGGKPERFIEGYIYAFGVSPDGCKIALNIGLHPGSRRGPEMVMADVCVKGN
jgi:hypothetical protein